MERTPRRDVARRAATSDSLRSGAYPPHWFGRFEVKPGVTGLWQVSGRCEVTLEEMIKLDLEYVRRRSVWLNVWILLRTVPAVLSLRGAL